MSLSAFVKGSCDDFCPPNEIKMRTTERLLHFYELHPPLEYTRRMKELPVKCFARSAAGTETPQSSDLRTFNSLCRTVEYLLEYILMDKRRPYHFRYDFAFDRLRSVRQEIVIQNLSEVGTVKLIEPIVMFLGYSSYKLTVPGKWLADILIYDNVQMLLSDCKYYNIEVNSELGHIKFDKLNFDRTKNVIPPRQENFADNAMLLVSIGDALLLH